LFDLDGIVITGRKHYFSYRLSQEHNIPVKLVEEFFLNGFRECSFGKADLKEKIAPFLIKWNWKGTVEDLLEYWFTSEGTINKEVLKIIGDLRSKGIKCYIATRQEKYRMQYLLDTVGLKNYFDGVFCTCDIGYDKWQLEFFEYVFKKLKLKPQEIMFFDDTQKNIDIISKEGVHAYFYENIDTLKKHTDQLLN
jgi:putative hydrolase of the HAD superfamily